MEDIERRLNNVYCISQKASKTLKSIKAYPELSNIRQQSKFYILVEELHRYSLEAYNHLKQGSIEDLKSCLDKLFSRGFSLEEMYKAFLQSTNLPTDNRLLKLLGNQIESILWNLQSLH